MKEALVILAVLAVILVLTVVRYRKQIAAMLHIWRSLKSMRNQLRQDRDQTGSDENIAAGPLVNCAKCGTWVPEQRAIRLRGGVFYCSANCLETTGKAR
jgi:hypothetical protein